LEIVLIFRGDRLIADYMVVRIADCIGFFTKISNWLLINSTSTGMIAVVTDANHENVYL